MIHKYNRGFGLIELLAVLGVLAIILAVALPNFLGWRSDAQLRSATEELKRAAKLARSTAIKEHQTVVGLLRQDGYIMFVDKANGIEPPNWKHDPGEPVVYQKQLPEDIKLEFIDPTTGDPAEAFLPSGRALDDRLFYMAVLSDKLKKEEYGIAGGLFPVDNFQPEKVSFVRLGGENKFNMHYVFYDGVTTGTAVNCTNVGPGFLIFYENGECQPPITIIVVNSKGEKFMIEITEWTITKITRIG